MILWIKLYCKNTIPSMAITQKSEKLYLEKRCRKCRVLGAEEEGTLVLGIPVVTRKILEQTQEAILEGDLMDMEVVMDLEMVTMDTEEDQEVTILEVVLVMEEEEEDMMVEDLAMATRMGAMDMVMTTIEEAIMEVGATMILETIISNLPTMV